MKIRHIAALGLMALSAMSASASDYVLQFTDVAWPNRPSTYSLQGWCNTLGYVPAQDCGYGVGGSSVGTDTVITLTEAVSAFKTSSGYDRYVLFGGQGGMEAVFRVVFGISAGPVSPGSEYADATLTMSLMTGEGVTDYIASLPGSASLVGAFDYKRGETFYFFDQSCGGVGETCPGNLFQTSGMSGPPDREGPIFTFTNLPVGLAVAFVPEPASSALALLGMLAIGSARLRRPWTDPASRPSSPGTRNTPPTGAG